MTEEQADIIKIVIYLAPPIIGAVVSILGGLAVRELQKMRKGVDELNIKIAVVIEKVNGHERRIRKLEK